MNTQKIAVLGSLTVDLFVQPSETRIITQTTENSSESFFALPHGGKISAEHIQEHFGGGSANVGISFARLGNDVSCFGGIGDDSNGKKILENLASENIASNTIEKFPETKSGFSLVLNAFDGERTVIFTSEANEKLEEISSLHPDFDAVYLCHISGKNPQKIFSQLEIFLEKNISRKFFWNPGKERILEGIEKNKKLLQHCDILFLNTEEAEKFSGIRAQKKVSHSEEMQNKHTLASDFQKTENSVSVPDFVLDVKNIAQKFLETGVKIVVITDGRKGAQAFSKQKNSEYLFIPCVSSKRVDTLGAGDSFASAFSHFYLNGETLKKCGEYASINAASVVSYQGAQDGLLKKSQILNK